MKMICIDNQNGFCHLTVGKEYEILDILSKHYNIKNDTSQYQRYEKKKFVTEDQYKLLLDRKYNPDLYYSPIEVNLSLNGDKVELEVLSMDDRFRGVGDLFDFIGKENPCSLKIISDYHPLLTKESVKLFGKKTKGDNNITGLYFYTNPKAINYLVEVDKAIKEFNLALFDVVIKNTRVYEVEHVPNGKLYSFISSEVLESGETAICDTSKGLAYGVVKNIIVVRGNTIFKKCRRIKNG